MSWIETYRGTVHRWEVDNVDHFTVAYYFERFEEATAAVVGALGLPVGAGRVTDCRARYLKELQVGDILHIRSGVLGLDDGALRLGHEMVDSASGAVCATLDQRAVAVEPGTLAPRPLAASERGHVDRLRVEWSVPPEPDRAEPRAPGAADDSRFIETARDTIKPWEVDGGGHADWPAHIHRFSAANAHVIAAFGMTPAYMREQRRGFSTFEFRLGFPGALRVGDPVRVRSGLAHVGSSSIRIAHRMTNAATGDLVATLEQSGVHLDMDARRPAPLPDEMRERARAMLV